MFNIAVWSIYLRILSSLFEVIFLFQITYKVIKIIFIFEITCFSFEKKFIFYALYCYKISL